MFTAALRWYRRIDILEVENEDELREYNPSCSNDVIKTLNRSFIHTLNRWLFANNQIAHDTLKDLDPKVIREKKIYGLVFGPQNATNLFNIHNWEEFFRDYLASDLPVNHKIMNRFTLGIKSVMEIAFLTERGREWLAYQGIQFANGKGNEIGHCGPRIHIDNHLDLMICGIQNNVLYGISQYPELFIKAYEIKQNEALIEQNMEFVIACCGEYLSDTRYFQLRQIIR